MLADSRVVHVGRKLATAEGRLYAEADEKLFATRHDGLRHLVPGSRTVFGARAIRPSAHDPLLARPMGATDAALIAASLTRPAAFAGVFDRHWPRLHRYCASRAGPAGEDLAAETFRVAFDDERASTRATTTPGRGSSPAPAVPTPTRA